MLKYHIQTIDVPSGGSSAISFNNIPQIYDDLIIVSSTRSSTADVTQYTTFTFNGSTTGYSFRYLFGNGGAGAQVFVSSGNRSDMLGPITNGNNSTANTFGNSQIFIPNYRSSANKSISIDAVMEQNATEAYPQIWSGLWANSSPITSIQIQGNTTFLQYSSISLYGVKRGADGVTGVSPAAEGGTVTTSGGYTIHTFTSSGVFRTNRSLSVEYLVIGGGGGGGVNAGAGGGAGGYRSSVVGQLSGGNTAAEPALSLPANTSYPVVVGAGGPAGTGSNGETIQPGSNGSGSAFGEIISFGGGGGAAGGNIIVSNVLARHTGKNGGSGGGSSAYAVDGTAGPVAGGTGTTGQGFSGGTATSSGNGIASAGGGGAGGAGANATASSGQSISGSGGAGLASPITGTSVVRASGGSAWQAAAVAGGGGGSGATNGAANTGGGGGDSGIGGSGIVIVRYLTPTA